MIIQGPIFIISGARAQSASAATLTPAKPAVNSVGGRLLAVIASKNNATHATATSGWTQIGAQINSGASFTASLWEAAEGSSAPVFTWTGAVACQAQVCYYYDPNSNPIAAIVAGTNNNGTASPHTTASFNSTRLNSLAVLVDVAASNNSITQPTGWALDVENGSATDAGRTAFASKQLGASGTASGAVSTSGAAAAWVEWQVELRIVAATEFDVTKIEMDAWLDIPSGLVSSKLEANVWLDVKDGLVSSKLEANTWLDSKSGLVAAKLEANVWLDALAGLYASKIEMNAWLEPGVAPVTGNDGYSNIVW